jgi:hypothetical protein
LPTLPEADAKGHSPNTSTLSRKRLGWVKMMKYKENKICKYWIHYGVLSGIGLGIRVDRYGWDIDFIKFYIGMEWQ